MAGEAEVEFFVPANVSDLEVAEKMPAGAYIVDVLVSVSGLSPHDQQATLYGVLHELGKKDMPTSIRDSDKFDTLFSFVKCLQTPSENCVSKECRQLLGTETRYFAPQTDANCRSVL